MSIISYMCPLPVLLSTVPAATDRKGAEGVRKIGRLQAADFPNGADSGTLDSLFFGLFDS